MSDARWREVEDDLASACRHYRNAARLYDRGGFDAEDLAGYMIEMALQHAMQSAHTSLELALLRLLEILGEARPAGDRWHADLIRRLARPLDDEGSGRPAVLTAEIARDLNETRRFQHRAVHGYDDFEAGRAAPSIEAARRLADNLQPAIAFFKATIDPPSAREQP